jgi:hypothetical protein
MKAQEQHGRDQGRDEKQCSRIPFRGWTIARERFAKSRSHRFHDREKPVAPLGYFNGLDADPILGYPWSTCTAQND